MTGERGRDRERILSRLHALFFETERERAHDGGERQRERILSRLHAQYHDWGSIPQPCKITA